MAEKEPHLYDIRHYKFEQATNEDNTNARQIYKFNIFLGSGVHNWGDGRKKILRILFSEGMVLSEKNQLKSLVSDVVRTAFPQSILDLMTLEFHDLDTGRTSTIDDTGKKPEIPEDLDIDQLLLARSEELMKKDKNLTQADAMQTALMQDSKLKAAYEKKYHG